MSDLFAYHDNCCDWGYMVLCNDCKNKAPSWVITIVPLGQPPTLGKEQKCEICGKKGILKD